ncbi:unnamed protein product [Adineta steineri]|uniref:Uncharacterized protein n=1 Tax=Adineta steineri TaxID=433720 RepID=A0A815AJW5_9BILA|nr:unnamed protein product [Adineta steineri]
MSTVDRSKTSLLPYDIFMNNSIQLVHMPKFYREAYIPDNLIHLLIAFSHFDDENVQHQALEYMTNLSDTLSQLLDASQSAPQNTRQTLRHDSTQSLGLDVLPRLVRIFAQTLAQSDIASLGDTLALLLTQLLNTINNLGLDLGVSGVLAPSLSADFECSLKCCSAGKDGDCDNPGNSCALNGDGSNCCSGYTCGLYVYVPTTDYGRRNQPRQIKQLGAD